MTRKSIGLYTGKWVFHIPHSNTFPPTFPRLVELSVEFLSFPFLILLLPPLVSLSLIRYVDLNLHLKAK
jgi:hypothetical protein